jgi:hypothetical protein
VEASAADIIALEPHTVVLAAGSRMLRPPGMPREACSFFDLRSAMGSLLKKPGRRSGTAIVFDMDHTEGTYASAELLHTLFERAVVITPREYIAQNTALVTRQAIVRRFHAKQIEVIPLAEPRWPESAPDKLVYANVYSGKTGVIENAAFAAYSTPRVPEDALAEPLRAAGIEVRLVGDCASPRGILAATAEGHAAGNTV